MNVNILLTKLNELGGNTVVLEFSACSVVVILHAFKRRSVIDLSACCLQYMNSENCVSATSYSNISFRNEHFGNQLLHGLRVTGQTRLKQQSD